MHRTEQEIKDYIARRKMFIKFEQSIGNSSLKGTECFLCGQIIDDNLVYCCQNCFDAPKNNIFALVCYDPDIEQYEKN
jgi:hypothetical protein